MMPRHGPGEAKGGDFPAAAAVQARFPTLSGAGAAIFCFTLMSR
jgi:hypothetical protein